MLVILSLSENQNLSRSLIFKKRNITPTHQKINSRFIITCNYTRIFLHAKKIQKKILQFFVRKNFIRNR